MARSHYVCLPCRYGFKRDEASDTAKCPRCGGPATLMGQSFRVPPRHADNQWRKIAVLASAGMHFRPYRDTTNFAASEYPITTYARAKRAAQVIRARNDAYITKRWQPRPPLPRLQRRPHFERRKLAALHRALQQARERHANAMQRGDHARAVRFEQRMTQLEKDIRALAYRQRARERGYIV